MYEVTIKKHFSAAHRLDIGGSCEELHGHNFTVEVTVASSELNEEGLVIDFRILKEWTDAILETMDHTFLNELSFFATLSPSSENIARIIFDKLAERMTELTQTVSYVTVWESDNARATYTR